MTVSGLKTSLPGGWAVLAAAAILLAVACVPNSVRTLTPVRSSPVQVIGTLVVRAGNAQEPASVAQIEIPDAQVFLVDARGRRAAQAVTRLDGHFELFAPVPGRYRFCYRLGSVEGCGPFVLAEGETVWLRSLAVAARGFVHGRVLTGDGRPCWVFDSFFGLDVSTQVSTVAAGSAGPPQASARANTQGEYALFGLDNGPHDVTARCEGATASGRADLRAASARRDLILPNHAPVVRAAAAFSGPRALADAVPGTSLDLRSIAADPDGDTIQYMWRTIDGGGQIVTGAASLATWQLPADEGLHSVYLMARDGRGGFTYRRIDLESSRANRVAATGRAIDEATGAPVGGASVTFGSASARTDANGWFAIESARRDDNRYVLNIRHPDYALTSRILERSARGDNYEMTPSQTGTTPGGAEIRLVDRTSASLCGSRLFANARSLMQRAAPRLIGAALLREGMTNERPPRAPAVAALPRCLIRGAALALPAGALVDARGEPATGAIRTAVATLNPARRALPGDYRAIPRGGGTSALLSFGAIDVRFSDASGRPLNLRSGAKAEIRMPVADDQLAAAPATMKMWSYDEDNGRWVEEGAARLTRTAEGAFYVGETSHFSAINMDIELNRPNATCVRFRIDPAFNAWAPLTLRAYVTYGGTSSQVQETVLDTSLYHSIRAIPYAPGNTLRLQLRGVNNNVPQVVLDDIIQLGPPRPQMTGSALFPPDPYVECDDAGMLSPAQGVLPDYGDMDATGRPAFLTGPAGTFNPVTPDTAAYYARLDTTGSNPAPRNTLGQWWGANGFDSATGASLGGTNDAEAAYTNYNDLGFGRDMHCLERSGARLACFVTNYGLPDQSVANANAAETHDALLRGATVTMEYEPSLGVNAVRFYVYGGGVATSPRVNFADLDGLGPKPVPYLCTVCHGGRYDAPTHDVQNSRFREFDLPSFVYPSGRTFNADFSGHTLQAGEITAFAKLNQMVRNAQPLIGSSQPTPIRTLVDRWYPGGFPTTLAPVQPVVPSGWSGAVTGYRDVYATACRTCHLARDNGNPAAFLLFDNATQFGFTTDVVCGEQGLPSPQRRRVMPNAYVTYRNFWADSTRVLKFEALMNPVASNCGS